MANGNALSIESRDANESSCDTEQFKYLAQKDEHRLNMSASAEPMAGLERKSLAWSLFGQLMSGSERAALSNSLSCKLPRQDSNLRPAD